MFVIKTMLKFSDLNTKSELKYFFLPIITLLFFASQYGIFIALNISNARFITIENTTSDNDFLILLWTPYFDEYSGWPKFEDLKCKYKNCIQTSNRALINISHALLFHWRDINLTDLPVYRNAKQTWIILNQESPHDTKRNAIIPYMNQINWTMTYRRDSDIFAPYGKIVKCNNNGWKPMVEFSKKVKNVAWIVSNCRPNSRREIYVKKLQNYIDVDIYGGCGEFVCERNSSCLENIAREYKFYLSFENSLCEGYVTEKLFNATKYDIIPIVLGGANYSAIMPPNSYIDVFNFSSPKDLAEYLHSVANDSDRYNSYLKWKENYCVIDTQTDMFCEMCDKLNNPSYHMRNVSINDWWFSAGNCKIGSKYKMFQMRSKSTMRSNRYVNKYKELADIHAYPKSNISF